jgi:triacylglycerol lipase
MDPLLSLLRQRPRETWTWTLTASRTTWSRDNALALANCARLAYSDPPTVRRHLLGRGFQDVRWCDPRPPSAPTQAYAAIRNDAVVVAFRGTEPTQAADWLTDLDAAQAPFEKFLRFSGWGRVHSGFAAGLATVLPAVVHALAHHHDDARALWITGHSLGGALALLAAAFVASLEHHPIAGVVTFGQPRVGDAEFAARYRRALGGRTFRCVNDHDVVPHVPPRMLSGIERLLVSGTPPRLADLVGSLRRIQVDEGYEHCGQLRLLLPAGGITEDATEEQAREPTFLTSARSLRGLAVDLPRLLAQSPALLKDHSPINALTHDGYIDRLENLSGD